MDFFNNAKGREMHDDLSFIAFGAFAIVDALNKGELRYLSNLEFKGGFWNATDNSRLIPTNQ